MRLDATDLRYVTTTEFRVLTAVEIGSKNHEVVPTPLISQLSGVRSGIVAKALSELLKRSLVARVRNAKYEGFRLTYGGLDYLALRSFSRRKPASVAAVGKKIGVGKESDIYLVKGEGGEARVLKLHRLGRISFRAIKSKRDYLGERSSASWMFMSRLSAEKEFAFMKVLYQHGFPVPTPIDQARHCVVMSLIDSYPLRQVDNLPSPADTYATLMALILRFASHGLIHGDFNEFNILIHRKTSEPIVIDFPQMVSTRHQNAEYFFNRDVECIKKFFRKRFRFEASSWPTWQDVLDLEAEADAEPSTAEGDGAQVEAESSEMAMGTKRVRLDLEVEASGFKREMQNQLMAYMDDVRDLPESDYEDDDIEEEEEDEDEDEDASKEVPPSTIHGLEAKKNDDQSFDEEAFQKTMSDRLEKLRLDRALGNTDTTTDGTPISSNSYLPSSSDSSDEEEGYSDGPAPTDFTTYTKERKVKPPRIDVRKLKPSTGGVRESIADKVRKERDGGGKKDGTAGKAKVGKMKGHKWKASDQYLVGKNSGW
ncbi:RIO1 family-domain-containing protein [Naematelia encephala]|uniref:Serine/threonine-protein kinase RIO2 n=1 Tax=Naematelia encephala TaxID=71784 RepID=A0A1Y2AZL0_9TREE|nr:RIO1 family-domain-containing protein [Naematelia encephala]